MSPAKPKPDTFFDLSFRGGVPELLRALALRIESGETHAEQLEWTMNSEHLVFTVRMDLEGKHLKWPTPSSTASLSRDQPSRSGRLGARPVPVASKAKTSKRKDFVSLNGIGESVRIAEFPPYSTLQKSGTIVSIGPISGISGCGKITIPISKPRAENVTAHTMQATNQFPRKDLSHE